MKIYQKVVLAITLTYGLLYFGLQHVLSHYRDATLSEAEKNNIGETKTHITAAYRFLQKVLNDKMSDWAAWDDAYDFVQTRNPAFKQGNLMPAAVNNLRVDYLALGDDQGNLIEGLARNSAGEIVPYPIELAEFAKGESLQDQPLSDFIKLSDGQICVFQIRKVFPSIAFGQKGAGYLLMGFNMSEAALKDIFDITGVSLKLLYERPSDVNTTTEAVTKSYIEIANAAEEKFFYLAFEIPRIYRAAQSESFKQEAITIVILLPLIVVLAFLISWYLVAKPLNDFRRNLDKVMDLSSDALLATRSSNEIGEIAKVFNELKVRNLQIKKQQEETQSLVFQRARISSLGEMAAGIAHEINNPLAIISGKVNVIRKKIKSVELDGSVDADLLRITATVERIAKIIKGLKTFSQGGDQLQFEVASLYSIVDEGLDFYREKLKNHNIELKLVNLDESAQNYLVKGKTPELQQVLANLLNNSYFCIKDQPKSWIEIRLEVRATDYLISITDSGKAISPEVTSKLFQPFFTTKPIGEGIGLGLSVSLAIVRSHGGDLNYDSNSENPKFVLTLPRYEAQQNSQKAA